MTYTNKLINEKSPYLLQHAHNPVNWYPWGEQAFEKAKTEDKPIFLSIGYSTCHWCHVMERESFEHEDVAALLNANFISVKVDREERPDVDHIYMNVCQSLTGHGGWPLTIMMTADKVPFFAGTYFPRTDQRGMQGLMRILQNVVGLWQDNRSALTKVSNQILQMIQPSHSANSNGLSEDVMHDAYEGLKAQFDSIYGGFDKAPKFPSPHNLFFLLRYYVHTGEGFALKMVEATLDAMAHGGIFDHIGFGFSRYSTDHKWLVPHFEKMLYDNALLAMAYLEAFQVMQKPGHSQVAEQIFTYVLRELTSPEGGFYAAEDADSEGVEGKFYVWTVEEVKQVLGDGPGEKFCQVYDITEQGNFEGKNIPNLIQKHVALQPMHEQIERLRLHRDKRIHPFKDDKILTAWNGLMIAAFAMGGRILAQEKYTQAAQNAVTFIHDHLVRADGRLLAGYRDGQAAHPAYADDYAFFVWGLLECFEATFDATYLKHAIHWTEQLITLFWDEQHDGFFVYGSDGEQLITRPKEIYDGAMPSGNSVMAYNFMRLARLTGQVQYEQKANQIMDAFGGQISNFPRGYTHAISAFLYTQAKSKEIVVVADQPSQLASEMLNLCRKHFTPFTQTIFMTAQNAPIVEVAPFVKDYQPIEGKPTAYVCENYACQPPVTTIDALQDMLQ
ncbi:MAG: thioredoxin domain-containing protein [Hyphomonadaceae bacterium]|nr:thioredoxin domain-containing protein [Clostridia bacterium]